MTLHRRALRRATFRWLARRALLLTGVVGLMTAGCGGTTSPASAGTTGPSDRPPEERRIQVDRARDELRSRADRGGQSQDADGSCRVDSTDVARATCPVDFSAEPPASRCVVDLAKVRRHFMVHLDERRRVSEPRRQVSGGPLEREAEVLAQRELRLEADRRAADALSRLSSLAEVHELPHIIIVALRREMLFDRGSAALTARGENHLRALASALRAQPVERRVRVEVRTDERGVTEGSVLSRQREKVLRQVLEGPGRIAVVCLPFDREEEPGAR